MFRCLLSSGSAGVFYKQFGLTLAIAIILSAVNALTLSPALCALFLKPHGKDEHKHKNFLQRFYTAFNTAFDATTNKYKRAVSFLSHRKWMALLGIAIFAGGLYFLMKSTPTGFVPNEDLGAVFSDISLPPGASRERTDEITKQIEKIARTVPEVQTILRITGRGIISGTGSNYGMVIMRLKPWAQRDGKGQDVTSIIGQMIGKTAGIRDAKIIFFAQPTIQGFGTTSGFEFQLQDKSGGDLATFNKVSTNFLGALNQRPEIQYAATSFNPNFPQYQIKCKCRQSKRCGVICQRYFKHNAGILRWSICV